MKYKVNDHSILNVGNEEAKRGSSWNDLTKRREDSAHPNGMGEDDIHRYKPYEHNHMPQADPEETKVALDSLEQKIKQMQHVEDEKKRMQQPPQQEPPQEEKGEYDDLYEDWFKE